MPAPAVAVDLLGPVRVRVDGVEVDIGGARPRALVAALALAVGQPVSADALTAAVWAGEAPPSATATLRVYVSRLRKVVGDALRSERGYVLDAEVDAERFRRLVAEADGEPAARTAALGAALALWRGEPLSGTVASAPLRSAAARLADAHLDARQAWAGALLDAGRPQAAVEQLSALVAEHPDRELVAADLMRALYRVGRQPEALAVYRRVRETLREQAGLEPSRALRDLHDAVLAHDPALLHAPGRAAAQPAGDDPAPLHAPGRPASQPAAHDPAVVPAPSPPPVGREPALVPAVPGPPVAAPPPPAVRLAAPTRTTNLPLPLTSFVGRAAELATLGGAIEDHRLLTLTGPGGTGKTRLALEACRRREDADGPWLVELAAVEEPDLVPQVVAQALGVGTQDGRTATEVLAAALEPRLTVVLLDNCEHVLDAAAGLAEVLLSRCPGLRVVATSREPLGVPGERIVTVGTLPVVERSPERTVRDGDAMRLFLDRARQVLHDLDPDPATLEVVRRICEELDGLPLAIELAAAELRTLSPAQLAEQLADRFGVLTSGPRTVLPRQRTLLTTVAWSVDLLDPAQRDLFAQLSVFVGGFDLDAVRAVCGAPAVSLLADLVGKSLVQVDRSTEPPRYRLLETLRQYGASLLDEAAAARVHARHARWCAALVAEAGEHLHGHDGPAWERRLDREIGNIRVGLRTTMADGEWSTALAMAGALWWYWFRRARLEEGQRWLAEITAAEQRRDGLLADAYYGRAFLAFFAADPAVEEHSEQGIAIAREAGDLTVLGRILASQAYRFAILGRLPEAGPILAEGLAVLPADAPAWVRAECAFSAGQVARISGDHALAQRRLERALALAEGCGHRWLTTVALWVLAEQALDVDRPREAARLLGRALDLARADGDRGAILGTLRSLAGVAARTGMPTDGARLLGMVTELGRRIGMHVDQMEQADAARTAEVLRAALRPDALEQAVAEGAGQPIGVAVALAGRILAAADAGR